MASTEVCLPAGPHPRSPTRPRSPDGIPHTRRLAVFGIDPHKATHTVVAVDALGRQVTQRTVAARTPQHRELITWARTIADDRVWAVEDCRHVSRRLERDLLAVGERIVRVPPKLMAATRTSIRSAGKSDAIDALAVARAALREPDLPTAQLDEPTRELKLLVDHREDLVAERTRVQNRLRWHVHELDPELQVPAGAMDQTVWLDQISLRLRPQRRGVSAVLVAMVAELVERVRVLPTQVDQLTRQITVRVQRQAPQLLTLAGCGPLCAAKLLVETADVRRFKSDAAFAMHAGVAPIPASSGKLQRHRLNRGGNRQLNAALHRIAITQLRVCPQTQAFRQRRLTAGSTRAEAVRALKRHLARRVYHLLHNAQQAQHHQHQHERGTA